MRKTIASMALLLLFFGCTFLQAPSQSVGTAGTVSGGGAAAAAQPRCSDGTPVGSCSAAKPGYCNPSQVLEPNPILCGCPAGTLLHGDSCISQCSDGTSFERCSRTKPKFCNQYGQLVDKASLCGCPELSVRSGEACVPACSDGTLPNQCSATQPNYCTESLTLTPDPERCGCPSGTVLQDGQCRAAKCIDGTPVGNCSSNMLPMYCGETLTLVRNPRVCGCLSDEILSEDRSQCLNPNALVYEEGDKFKVFGDTYMRISDAEWVECANGDYIRMQLQIDNSEGELPYWISESDLRLFMRMRSSQAGTWVAVEYPSHDGLCSEPDKFAWTYTMEGDINTGMVWFRLPGFYERSLEYSVYYKGIRIELDPS